MRTKTRVLKSGAITVKAWRAAVMSWRVARKRNTDRRFFRRLNKRRLIILTNRGDVTTPRSWRCAASIVRRPTKTFDPKYYATLTVRTRKREGRKGRVMNRERGNYGRKLTGEMWSRTTFQDFQREKWKKKGWRNIKESGLLPFHNSV